MADKKLKVTLVRSAHGRIPGHKATLLGLGLKHQRQSRVLVDTPAVRGMINKVSYLIKTEEA